MVGDVRRQAFVGDREVDGPHLPPDELFQANVFLDRSEDPEVEIRIIGRDEEGESLDVIPVKVGQKDAGSLWSCAPAQAIPQQADSRAGIKDDPGVAGPDLNAGGVSPVSDGGVTRGGDRPTGSPVADRQEPSFAH